MLCLKGTQSFIIINRINNKTRMVLKDYSVNQMEWKQEYSEERNVTTNEYFLLHNKKKS